MDTHSAIRREELVANLRAALRQACAAGMPAEDALGTLMEVSCQVYAVEVSGARTKKERHAAARLFTNHQLIMLRALPTQAKDAMLEVALIATGHGGKDAKRPG